VAKHVRNTIEKLIKSWNKEGFGGIRVEANLEGEFVAGDEPKKDWVARAKNYAIFLFVPYFPYDLGPYESFDEDLFWWDFATAINNELPDCTVTIYNRAQEIED
jgi:hypothetical protein